MNMRMLLQRVREGYEEAVRRLRTHGFKEMIDPWRSICWGHVYRLRSRVRIFCLERRSVLAGLLLVSLFAITLVTVLLTKKEIGQYFSSKQHVGDLRALLLMMGGALFGAAAISFGLIMFAMQVNIERVPYGLFRRLSSDRRLVAAFFGTFVLSIIEGVLGVVLDKGGVVWVVLAATWCTLGVLCLIFLSYKRALSLINPLEQLHSVVKGVKENFAVWEKAAERAGPVIRMQVECTPEDSGFDWVRATFFRSESQWMRAGQGGLAYCNSYARRYAEQGDYEIVRVALDGVVGVNAMYVKAKGRTFFSASPLGIDVPSPTDGFINETLEHLRRNVQVALSRGDEQFLELNFRAMFRLSELFLRIEYPDDLDSKFHAHLAVGYLGNAVEGCLPRNMPDVLMGGIQLLGQAAISEIQSGKLDGVSSIVERIAAIGCSGTRSREDHPVARAGVEQLQQITCSLLLSKCMNIRYDVEKLRECVSTIGRHCLGLADGRPRDMASDSLSPYYSSTSLHGLMAWMRDMTDVLCGEKKETEKTRGLIAKVEQWSDGIYKDVKGLLIQALTARSSLAYDMVHWIGHVSELLLVISNAQACNPHDGDKLRMHASWLISVISWIPDDESSVRLVASYQLEEILFRVGRTACNQNATRVCVDVEKLLVSWAFKAKRYKTGCHPFGESLCGAVVLDILSGGDGAVVVDEIRRQLGESGLSNEARLDAAEWLENASRTSQQYGPSYSAIAIEHEMSQVNGDVLEARLKAVSEQLRADVEDEGT